MPATRVAINGFGRMGRLALRAAGTATTSSSSPSTRRPATRPARRTCSASTPSTVAGTARPPATGDTLTVDGIALSYGAVAAPGDVAWEDHGAEIVLECSGRFRTVESLQPYFARGVKKVIVAAPVKDPRALNVVVGVNDDRYDPDAHDILTAASCTTNCLAPVVKVLHEGIGIRRGSITTLHDMTNTQTLVDAPAQGPAPRAGRVAVAHPHDDRVGDRDRAHLPRARGPLDGLAVRVPLLNASLTDAVFEVARPTTSTRSTTCCGSPPRVRWPRILGYEERPLVSVDYKDDPRSAIVDGPSTMVTDGTQVKVLAWYDNEWGYANRLVELAATVGAGLRS